jgi:hypothetical protein
VSNNECGEVFVGISVAITGVKRVILAEIKFALVYSALHSEAVPSCQKISQCTAIRSTWREDLLTVVGALLQQFNAH